MIDQIRAAIAALNKGEELSHAEVWKNRQTLANTLVAFFSAVAVFLPERLNVTHEDMLAIATGIAAIAGVSNAYLVPATSARVGLPSGAGDS